MAIRRAVTLPWSSRSCRSSGTSRSRSGLPLRAQVRRIPRAALPERRECHFRSKRGNVLKQFRELCDWVRQELRVKEAILDGEVVALDPEGRQDFRALLARRGNLHYAAFDVLWLNGKDLRGLPLTRRKRALERVIPATTTVLSRVFAVEGRGRDIFAAAERLDLEGIVAKRKGIPTRRHGVVQDRNRAYTQMEGGANCST